jgi:hypothetical protein
MFKYMYWVKKRIFWGVFSLEILTIMLDTNSKLPGPVPFALPSSSLPLGEDRRLLVEKGWLPPKLFELLFAELR